MNTWKLRTEFIRTFIQKIFKWRIKNLTILDSSVDSSVGHEVE